jgi:hypothetical protein
MQAHSQINSAFLIRTRVEQIFHLAPNIWQPLSQFAHNSRILRE